MNASSGCERMPPGWMQNRLPELTRIECTGRLPEVQSILSEAFWGDPGRFLLWLPQGLNQERPAFERAAIARDIEELQSFFEQQARNGRKTGQMALI
jgi:hypothetical protein